VIEASPYTPGFGIVPEALTGRAEALERHVTALHQGPRHPAFTQAVIGERGIGKTVYLSVLAQRMHDDHNWIVLPYQARAGADAIPELLAELPDVAGRGLRGRELRALERELSVELNAGVVKVAGKVSSPAATGGGDALAAQALRRALDATGERAAKHGTGVLVTVDEAQTLTPAAISDLGMIAQTVAHGRGRPVAIVMAGTPELSTQLIQSGTFLERMPRTELGMLSREDARLALLEPANARGVTWERSALTAVCNQAGGYPYFVQLGGHAAWEHADDAGRITRADGLAACREINSTADRMFRDRWARLGPAQREYLTTVALSDRAFPLGPVPTGHVAAVLGKEHSELTRVRSSLVNDHHLLRSAGRGAVEFAIPRFAGWLRDQLQPADEHGTALEVDPDFAQYLPARPAAAHERDARAAADLTRATRGGRGRATSVEPAARRAASPPATRKSRGR
jgi:type II secretory pathway predicted ATPase ExeA